MTEINFLLPSCDLKEVFEAIEKLRSDMNRVLGIAFNQLITDVVIHELNVQNDAIRDLLGQWVSEMEPEVFYGPGVILLGIGAKGSGVISLRAVP